METVPGIPKSSPPPGSWVPGSVGWAGDRNSVPWIPVGPVVGGQLEPSVTQLEESFPRAGAGLMHNKYNCNSDDIISSTVK